MSEKQKAQNSGKSTVLSFSNRECSTRDLCERYTVLFLYFLLINLFVEGIRI